MAQRLKTDWILFSTVLAMVVFGVLVVYSASSIMAYQRYRSAWHFVERQAVWAALGLFAMCYLGLGISILPMIVPYSITFWAAASSPKSQAFLMIGTLFLLPILVFTVLLRKHLLRGITFGALRK